MQERDILSESDELNTILRSGVNTNDGSHCDLSRDIKKAMLGRIIHDEPDKVLDYIMKDTEYGKFKRFTIDENGTAVAEIDRKVSLWTYTENNICVEFLLDIKVSPVTSTNSSVANSSTVSTTSDSSNLNPDASSSTPSRSSVPSSYVIELKSCYEQDLPNRHAVKALLGVKSPSNATKLVWARMTNCRIKIDSYKFGQSIVTFYGDLEAESAREERTAKESRVFGAGGNMANKSKSKTFRSRKQSILQLSTIESNMSTKSETAQQCIPQQCITRFAKPTSLGGQLLITAKPSGNRQDFGNASDVLNAIHGFFGDVAKHFDQPDVIDRRMFEDFVENVMPKAPPLNEDELEMLGSLKILEKELYSNGKRLPGTVKDDVEKFRWKMNEKLWGAYCATFDVSAKEMMAYFTLVDTYEGLKEHKENQHGEPRKIIMNVNGTRSTHYKVGLYFPPPYNSRMFEIKMTWKEEKMSDGRTQYIVGLRPLNDIEGNAVLGHTQGETTGIYFIREIAPKVCHVVRIQSVDLHAHLPETLVNLLTKYELKSVEKIQEKFRRNGNEVDDEIRAVIVERMKQGVQLEQDQEEVFENLKNILGANGDSGDWKQVESSKFAEDVVKIEMKHVKQKKGESSIAVARAVCTSDCIAEEAAAWFFDYCSRERTAEDREKGGPARLDVTKKNARINEKIFASIKKMPFPMRNREFVVNVIWRRNDDESISIAFSPFDEKIDYGSKIYRLVKGKSYGLVNFQNIDKVGEIDQCEMTYTVYIDMAGFIPTSILERRLPDSLIAVASCARKFKRDKEIDYINVENFKDKVNNEPQSYDATEQGVLDRGKKFFKRCLQGKSVQQVTDDQRITLKDLRLENDHVAAVLQTNVDADPLSCLAHDFLKELREKRLKKKSFRKLVRQDVQKLNTHAQLYRTVRNTGIPGVWLRDCRSIVLWQKDENGDIWIVYEDTNLMDEEFPWTGEHVKASLHTVWKIQAKKETSFGFSRTLVTAVTEIDLGGKLPMSAKKFALKTIGNTFSEMRKKFDKSIAIDHLNRARIMERMKKLKVREKGRDLLDSRFSGMEGMAKVKSAFSLSDTWSLVEGNGCGWGMATVKVGTSLEEAVAFVWDFASCVHLSNSGDRERIVLDSGENDGKVEDGDKGEEKDSTGEENESEEDKFGKEEDSEGGDLESVVWRRQKIESKHGAMHRERGFKNVMRVRRVSKDTIIITMDPLAFSKEEKAKFKGHVSQERTAVRFTKISDTETRVEYVTILNLGRNVGKKATEYSLHRHLDEAAEMGRYFTSLVRLEEMNSKTGEAVGLDMVWTGGELVGRHSRNERIKHVKDVVKASRALHKVCEKYPWLVVFLQRACTGDFAVNHPLSTKLVCVTEREARILGNNMMPSLRSRKLARSGVDQWRLQNRAAAELLQEFPWMYDMLVALGEGVIKAAPWGLMFRVITGAIISLIDLITDLYVAKMYLEAERNGYFMMIIGMVSLSMTLQSAFVFMQYRRLGVCRVLAELIPVLVGLKPALDAYRVAKGMEQEAGTSIDVVGEMTCIKCVEMFAESIPAVIIQTLAIGTFKGGASTEAVLSLGVSMFSAGFICACLSYDYDTDPKRREQTPGFYGYVPSKALQRSIVFFSMIFFSSSMLLIRCTTLCLLGLVELRYAILYVIADLFLYLLVKIMRRDFWYWLPLSGFSLLFTSFFARIITKIITDFSSLVQLRHPNEVGGAYWTFSFFFSMVSLPMAIIFYESRKGSSETARLAKLEAMILLPSVIVVISIFFKHINKRYRRTFLSIKRGKDMTVEMFRNSEDDGKKALAVFKRNKKHWESIEFEVQTFVQSNWSKWAAENPKWLTHSVRARIPLDYIPTPRERLEERVRRMTSHEAAMSNVQSGRSLRQISSNLSSSPDRTKSIGTRSIKKILPGRISPTSEGRVTGTESGVELETLHAHNE
mmetsp:Transcript_10792/g.22152  ORF Transcript_10792/g.22152 Transcript_10792/m.22152 type:complete len:1934 (-) Transcript_10792:39-5840(-)|eukprot:CAMPEP_0118648054 /NCGR_PEP_ID=MMETSP0785-20121206/8944_1 /TAXON_ID=91992 /ORGANISM="Bolidomonas pacifica, Strain CCMP 1866" /LENGTH=1933 /DNA_ID=CAMNT_0006540207 /DNA_START=111 /DNA_END=5912 /DNA_ORIENTATION=-